MKVGNGLRFVQIKYPGSSLYSLIADGSYRSTYLGRQKWKSLISSSSLQYNCQREGFNAFGGHAHNARIRIGIIGNNEHDCDTTDSYIGFGGSSSRVRRYCGRTNIVNSCGNSASCGPDNGDKEIKAMGYIFVR